jgi:hypothetical protein
VGGRGLLIGQFGKWVIFVARQFMLQRMQKEAEGGLSRVQYFVTMKFQAGMAELADAADSKSAGTRYLGGSTPPPGTKFPDLFICSLLSFWQQVDGMAGGLHDSRATAGSNQHQP